MVWVLLFVLLQPPERVPAVPLTVEESARREALTRYGLGVMQTRRELPVQALKQFEAAEYSTFVAMPFRRRSGRPSIRWMSTRSNRPRFPSMIPFVPSE